jgi:hypothetical protein
MSEASSIEPVAGFELAADTIVVGTAHQQEKLALIGIAPDVFGDCVDPSFFIGLAIHAGIKSGISAEGAINMVQSLTMHRRPLLDAPLEVGGTIKAVREVPRGVSVDTEVQFKGGDGQLVISANRTSLRPHPEKAPGRGAGDRAPPIVPDVNELELSSRFELTPDCVKAYSSEGNSIHYDLDAAQKAGFRAPLIGGGMGVHFLMADLFARRSPSTFDCDIYFRRPIFWDETVTVGRLGNDRALALVKRDGHVSKVATEIALNRVSSSEA